MRSGRKTSKVVRAGKSGGSSVNSELRGRGTGCQIWTDSVETTTTTAGNRMVLGWRRRRSLTLGTASKFEYS